ncbi:MAG: methyl-accepting chemotaxis protein [Nitrospira sp.]|nr:methyl-accepting chemotaxis protein [bacterium]MBL7048388.1 methyl-accepting chemotaxis protein [Nitrospira sp.]
MECRGIKSLFKASCLLSKLKIKNKIILMSVLSVIIFTSSAAWQVTIGQSQIETLDNLYNAKIVPLDKLRKMQLRFRETEFRIAGVKADMVTGTGAAVSLKETIKIIDELWAEAEHMITNKDLAEDVANISQAYKGFKSISKDIEKSYMAVFYDADTGPLEDVYDEWLDYKPFLFKSIDHIVETMEHEVSELYIDKKLLVAQTNKFIIIASFGLIIFFTVATTGLIKSINTPITTVMNAAREVARGDLSQNINLISHDEMGIMAAELNKMITTLNTSFGAVTSEAEEIQRHAGGLSDVAQFMISGNNDQKMQIEQVVTASTEVAQTTSEMAKSAAEASAATTASVEVAKKGQSISDQTRKSIETLVSGVAEAAEAIGNLDKSSQEIVEIVGVIKDIADQTNLLALMQLSRPHEQENRAGALLSWQMK